MSPSVETSRIQNEYERRKQAGYDARYSRFNLGQLFLLQNRERALLRQLSDQQLTFGAMRILDIGCGQGQWLVDLESWGAQRGFLAGVDLLTERVAIARARLGPVRDDQGTVLLPGAAIHQGDASSLVWPDSHFDLVILSTTLSSILDSQMRRAIAEEVHRVLKPGASVLWYDFFVNNPHNRNVRGVSKRELKHLFPGYAQRLKRVTLAPPLARFVAPLSWLLASVIESLGVLNTHYIGLLTKPHVAAHF